MTSPHHLAYSDADIVQTDAHKLGDAMTVNTMNDEPEKKDDQPEFLAAVDRTLKILEMLADESEGLSISDIARRLEVNKAIAHRILSTLAQLGYVYRTENQFYQLTYKISNIGLRQQSNARLTDQCFPLIRQLADETGELVRLAVIEHGIPIWVHAASGPVRRLTIDPIWRAELIWHVHAAAKAYLSTLDPDDILPKIGHGPYRSLTLHTITDPAALLEDVAAAAARGFALSYEEAELGVGAVASPIFLGGITRQRCVGILSVAAPTSRMNRDALIKTGVRLIEACAVLGGVWPLSATH